MSNEPKVTDIKAEIAAIQPITREKNMWLSFDTTVWLNDVANLVFIVSLLVGLLATYAIFWTSGLKEQYLNIELSRSREKTASLEKQSEEIKLSAAEANARAEEARLALEKFKAPRVIVEESAKQIVEKMRAYSGVPFDVATSQEKESISLVVAIENVLEKAGLIQHSWASPFVIPRPGKLNIGICVETGVSIQFLEASRSKFQDAVQELSAALNAVGIAASGALTPPNTPSNSDVIHICVGAKP